MKTLLKWAAIALAPVVALLLMGPTATALALPSFHTSHHLLMVGAIAGNAVTVNTVSALSQLFKKTATGLLTALQDQTPELKWLRKTPDASLIPSGLEMRLILNVLFQGGGQMIPDGGYESIAGVQAPQSGTVTFVQYNNRFALTGLGRMYDRYAKQGEVMALNYYAAKKVLEAMGRKMGYQTYGFSTGTLALVDTTVAVTTTDVLLKSAFGSSLIGSTNALATANQKTYMAQLFRAVGEVIAPLSASDVVTNGQATVNSVSNANGTVNLTTPGSATFTAGNPLVYFNSVTDVTKAGTELNLWPVGLLDATQSTTVHGLSSSTAPNWKSYTDTSGGRFGFIKLRQGQQYINNYGGTEPDTLILSNGVLNDATAAERAARIYPGVSMFDLDGNLKAKGIEIRTSLLAPPGIAFLYDSAAYTKLDMGDLPSPDGGPDLFDIDKLPNQNIWAASLNYAYLRAVLNRAAIACYSGLTEQ